MESEYIKNTEEKNNLEEKLLPNSDNNKELPKKSPNSQYILEDIYKYPTLENNKNE
jgi:hypothetical protein